MQVAVDACVCHSWIRLGRHDFEAYTNTTPSPTSAYDLRCVRHGLPALFLRRHEGRERLHQIRGPAIELARAALARLRVCGLAVVHDARVAGFRELEVYVRGEGRPDELGPGVLKSQRCCDRAHRPHVVSGNEIKPLVLVRPIGQNELAERGEKRADVAVGAGSPEGVEIRRQVFFPNMREQWVCLVVEQRL